MGTFNTECKDNQEREDRFYQSFSCLLKESCEKIKVTHVLNNTRQLTVSLPSADAVDNKGSRAEHKTLRAMLCSTVSAFYSIS